MNVHIEPADARHKLERLAEEYGYGYNVEEFLETTRQEELLPGICTRKGCFFIEEYGPQEDAGQCDECGTATVVSGLVLARLR